MKKAIVLRLPETTLEAVDRRAAEVGTSRNEWLTRVVDWALKKKGETVTITTTKEVTL